MTLASQPLTPEQRAALLAKAAAKRTLRSSADVAAFADEHAEPVPVITPRPLKPKAPKRTYAVHTNLHDSHGQRLQRLTMHIRQTERRRIGDNVTLERAIEALEEKYQLPPLDLRG